MERGHWDHRTVDAQYAHIVQHLNGLKKNHQQQFRLDSNAVRRELNDEARLWYARKDDVAVDARHRIQDLLLELQDFRLNTLETKLNQALKELDEEIATVETVRKRVVARFTDHEPAYDEPPSHPEPDVSLITQPSDPLPSPINPLPSLLESPLDKSLTLATDISRAQSISGDPISTPAAAQMLQTPETNTPNRKKEPKAVDGKRKLVDTAAEASPSSKRSKNDVEPPQADPLTDRTISFDDVHQNGNAEYKHTIVLYWGHHYILKCDEHGLHFRPEAVIAAAKHLSSEAHGNQPRYRSNAISKLGFLVTGCTKELMEKHNKLVTEAFENGYQPLNLKTKKSRAAHNDDQVQSSRPGSSSSSKGMTTKAIPSKTASNKATSGKVAANKPSKGIFDPVVGELYFGFAKPTNPGDKAKKFVLMIMPWKELDSCGWPGQTLGETPLLQDAKRKTCYLYDRDGISGWSPGYEDNGPNVKKRWFPVLWFEEKSDQFGWIQGDSLSPFNPSTRPPGHPETRAIEQRNRARGCVETPALTEEQRAQESLDIHDGDHADSSLHGSEPMDVDTLSDDEQTPCKVGGAKLDAFVEDEKGPDVAQESAAQSSAVQAAVPERAALTSSGSRRNSIQEVQPRTAPTPSGSRRNSTQEAQPRLSIEEATMRPPDETAGANNASPPDQRSYQPTQVETEQEDMEEPCVQLGSPAPEEETDGVRAHSVNMTGMTRASSARASSGIDHAAGISAAALLSQQAIQRSLSVDGVNGQGTQFRATEDAPLSGNEAGTDTRTRSTASPYTADSGSRSERPTPSSSVDRSTPPGTMPNNKPPTRIKAEPGPSRDFFLVSGYKAGSAKWVDFPDPIKLAVSDAGAGTAKGSNDTEIIVNAQEVHTIQYSAQKDLGRYEVTLVSDDAEQRLLFTTGTGRSTMQALMFQRWVKKHSRKLGKAGG